MIQSIFSTAIEVLFIASTLYFAASFLLSTADKVSLKVQSQGINPIALPTVSPAPISYLTAEIALYGELTSMIVLTKVPAAIASVCMVNFAPPAALLRSLLLKAGEYLKLLLSKPLESIGSSLNTRHHHAHALPLRTTAAKAVKRPLTTSVQGAATSDHQIILSNCKTGKLRGHTYIDINDLPTAALPTDVKIYSVRGRFQGMKITDLQKAGFIIHW